MIQILAWAAGYDLLGSPLAAGALAWAGIALSPAVGAFSMSCLRSSSLSTPNSCATITFSMNRCLFTLTDPSGNTIRIGCSVSDDWMEVSSWRGLLSEATSPRDRTLAVGAAAIGRVQRVCSVGNHEEVGVCFRCVDRLAQRRRTIERMTSHAPPGPWWRRLTFRARNVGQALWVSVASSVQLVSVDDTGNNIELDRPDVVLDKIHDLLQ